MLRVTFCKGKRVLASKLTLDLPLGSSRWLQCGEHTGRNGRSGRRFAVIQARDGLSGGLSGGNDCGIQEAGDWTGTQDRVKVRRGRTGFWVGILIKTETTGEETILGPE